MEVENMTKETVVNAAEQAKLAELAERIRERSAPRPVVEPLAKLFELGLKPTDSELLNLFLSALKDQTFRANQYWLQLDNVSSLTWEEKDIGNGQTRLVPVLTIPANVFQPTLRFAEFAAKSLDIWGCTMVLMVGEVQHTLFKGYTPKAIYRLFQWKEASIATDRDDNE